MITTCVNLKGQWYQVDFPNEKKCLICKSNMKESIVRFPNIFSGEFLAHIKMTHGLEPSTFIKIIEENIIAKLVKR